MTGRPSWIRSCGALAAVGMLAVGCGDASGGPADAHRGTLQVRLTDAPTDELAAVNVFIAGLTIKPAGGSVERIAGEIGTVDLLTLEDTSQLLTTAGVEPGAYEFIQVDLDEARSGVADLATGTELPLRIPSEEIKVLGGFTVGEGGVTTVVLDFDADASLRRLGSGEWLLEPVILIDSVTAE